jgi:hypothetical protein
LTPEIVEQVPEFSQTGWKTDFTQHTVLLAEISSGGPPRDGIPPIDHPNVETIAQANAWLSPPEPVVALSQGSEVRAYPLQILIWHEIVNDALAGRPVTVTFCPLCNTAIAFDREVDGRVLDFGTTGNLRHSDLIMWDRQTESWWQQFTGEAIVGELAGKRLATLPATIIAWQDFRQRFPQGTILSRVTGFQRDYGHNPYVGYDRADQSPFLFRGKPDGRLPLMERVLAVTIGTENVAYPFTTLQQRGVVADTVGGTAVVVFYQLGTTSALDGSDIASSRDVGAAAVYRATLDGRTLSFRAEAGLFVDNETGSRWTLLGEASAGPLLGKHLDPIDHTTPFWFAEAAFKPMTRVYR